MSGLDERTMRDAQLACLWEASARKPGNVHRYRDFSDASYLDFLASSAAIAPVLGRAAGRPVGETVLECVRRTREVAASNTNLGIVLLLAPLAAAGREGEYQAGVERVLAGLTVEDSRNVYEAIRLAAPGGLGQVEEGDVSGGPTRPLRELMALAADRDLVARQYANGFEEVIQEAAPLIRSGARRLGALELGIVWAQLMMLHQFPDTLIARKCGPAVAQEAARRAEAVLAALWPGEPKGRELFRELDAWLRADGNRRNPGTTADVIAAGLFVLLQRGEIALPLGRPWALDDGAV